MLKIIGSMICPDTKEAVEKLDAENKRYEFIDILNSLENLKIYLEYRDTQNCYDTIRKNHGIGIPCFVTEHKVTLDITEVL